MSNDELKLINLEYDGERVTAPILERPFYSTLYDVFEHKNESKKNKRKESMREMQAARTCEGMLITCL